MQKKRKNNLFLFNLVLALSLAGFSAGLGQSRQTGEECPPISKINGESITPRQVEEYIRGLMVKHPRTYALSLAVVNGGKIAWSKTFGIKNRETGAVANEDTVFRAASLSKPVFAYLVLKLVEEGVLDLDKPLYQYLNKPLYEYTEYADLKGDTRFKAITARLVLSHQTGFPNWRRHNKDMKLNFLFSPGDNFSYSGEGYQYLQFLIEKITGKDLNRLSKEKVFLPLGMKHSCFRWEDRFDKDISIELEGLPAFLIEKARKQVSGAGSMITNAHDYALFLTALLNTRGLGQHWIAEMLKPQVFIRTAELFGPGSRQQSDQYKKIGLSWCQGWGKFETRYGDAFFHVGYEPGCENYVVMLPAKKIALVFFSTQKMDAASIAAEIARHIIGDTYSPFSWMGYH